MDLLAHDIFEEQLRMTPISYLASEESHELLEIDTGAAHIVAIDPLDGSSNIDTNMTIGSIFSVLQIDVDRIFTDRLGEHQKAAGFLVYGPQTVLVLSCGNGCRLFALNPSESVFYLLSDALTIPPGQREFAINTSNYRFWDTSIRHFIDDCISGEEGPLGVDFNMRWNASLVAEAFRILVRGGVFLYPADSRAAYANGRLRFLYEALPLAFIIEQAGGMASDGDQPIVNIKLDSLHQRVPFIFGSRDMVEDVVEYVFAGVEFARPPLFGSRGLLRN